MSEFLRYLGVTFAVVLVAGIAIESDFFKRLRTPVQPTVSYLVYSAPEVPLSTDRTASPPASPARTQVKFTPPAEQNFRARAASRHIVPSSEELWQQEPLDPLFVQAQESELWQRLSNESKLTPTDIKCRSKSCKVEVILGPGVTLDALDDTLNGFSPYHRSTDNAWTFFYNPDLVE